MKENKKGITLIALIITIIVMLILVAVTVIMVNSGEDGGIFGRADEASRKTEKEAIYDQIVGAMQLDDNGKFNADSTYDKAKEILESQGMEVGEKGTDGIFTVKGKRGTYTYKITGSGIEKDPSQEVANITWYELKPILNETEFLNCFVDGGDPIDIESTEGEEYGASAGYENYGSCAYIYFQPYFDGVEPEYRYYPTKEGGCQDTTHVHGVWCHDPEGTENWIALEEMPRFRFVGEMKYYNEEERTPEEIAHSDYTYSLIYKKVEQ